MDTLTTSIYADLRYGEDKPVFTSLINNEFTTEARITFRSGQIMKEHKAPYPIVVSVIEGEIEFKIGQENHLLEKGMMICVAAKVLHELKANTDSIVRVSIHKSNS